jgi:hypothetical protein
MPGVSCSWRGVTEAIPSPRQHHVHSSLGGEIAQTVYAGPVQRPPLLAYVGTYVQDLPTPWASANVHLASSCSSSE